MISSSNADIYTAILSLKSAETITYPYLEQIIW